MSGVVGWIDFTRNLVLDRPVVTGLVGTLAARGPDGEAVWVSPHAALGVRVARTDPSVDGQPYVVDGSEPVTVCVTGPVVLTEVRDRLRSAGEGLSPQAPAAEVVARAYLRWGAEFVPWLDGSFSLAIWDGRTEDLVLARDRLGGQPLYYTHTPTGMVFASERKTLLAHPEVSRVVTAAGLREAISHALPPGGIFAGFATVAAAEIARFNRGGWRRDRYWQLETRPHTDDVDTTVARIRAMLEDGIRQSLPEDPANLLATLSGGIDSSAVVALAAAELRRRGHGPLRTFTVDFADNDFQPSVMRGSRDEPYANLVAQHVGADHRVVQLDATDILHPLVRVGILRAKDWPTRIYDMDASQFLFTQRAAAEGGRIALTGGAGDQLFQGARWSTDPGLVAAPVFPWVAMAQRHGAANGFGTGLLSHDLLAALDLPAYYRDAYAHAVAEVEFLDDEDERQRQQRRVAYLVLTRGPLDGSVYAACGLQMRAPINTHQLVQYAYNIPAEMHTHGGIEKGLLRAAVADLLPEEVLRRPQSATPVSQHPGYTQRLMDELKTVLTDPHAPVRDLIDLKAAAALADQPTRLTKDRLARAAVELTLQLNLWLDHYRVRLVL